MPKALSDRNFELLETNGIRLRTVVEGDGPLVILLHGFPQCWYLGDTRSTRWSRPAGRWPCPTCAATAARTARPGWGTTASSTSPPMSTASPPPSATTTTPRPSTTGAPSSVARRPALPRACPGGGRAQRALRAGPRLAGDVHPGALGRPLLLLGLHPAGGPGRGRAGSGRPRNTCCATTSASPVTAPPGLASAGPHSTLLDMSPPPRHAAPLADPRGPRLLRRAVRAQRLPGRPELLPQHPAAAGADPAARGREGPTAHDVHDRPPVTAQAPHPPRRHGGSVRRPAPSHLGGRRRPLAAARGDRAGQRRAGVVPRRVPLSPRRTGAAESPAQGFTTMAVTMPNMPCSDSTWLRMWQCHTQVPGRSRCMSTV